MGNGNKAEMLIAVCAVITSVVALYIGWDQARVMRLQQKADVWPLLQIDQITSVENGNLVYRMRIESAGVGPAFLERYVITVPGEKQTTDISRFYNYMIPEGLDAPMISNESISGRVMRYGRATEPFSLTWPYSDASNQRFQERISEILQGERDPAILFVCYCSILDDCWVTSSENFGRPNEVESCKSLPAVAAMQSKPRENNDIQEGARP
jgi:hypothetical protein